MTFPNPVGYYLPTPEQIETEIAALTLHELAYLNYKLADFLEEVLLGDHDEQFSSVDLSEQSDTWINNLKADALINLIRWVAERLAHLYHKEIIGKTTT